MRKRAVSGERGLCHPRDWSGSRGDLGRTSIKASPLV
jgi:hypothetical protein